MSHIFDHNQIPTFTDLRLPHAQIPEWKSLPLIRAVQPPPRQSFENGLTRGKIKFKCS